MWVKGRRYLELSCAINSHYAKVPNESRLTVSENRTKIEGQCSENNLQEAVITVKESISIKNCLLILSVRHFFQ
jgi:hypothetical protein